VFDVRLVSYFETFCCWDGEVLGEVMGRRGSAGQVLYKPLGEVMYG
jgi:hypothetical protein